MVGKGAVERIVREVQRRSVAFDAGDVGPQGLGVVAGQGFGGGLGVEIDAGDAGIRKGDEFVGLADAVLVEVALEFDVGVLRVGGVEDAIAVGVDALQGVEAVFRFDDLAARVAVDHRIDAEELGAAVYRAIAVPIQHHERIVALQPPGAGLDAVAVVVELHPGIDAHRLNAVAVEVEGKGVAEEPAAGLEEFIVTLACV